MDAGLFYYDWITKNSEYWLAILIFLNFINLVVIWGHSSGNNDTKEREAGQGDEEPEEHIVIIFFWHDEPVDEAKSQIGKCISQAL